MMDGETQEPGELKKSGDLQPVMVSEDYTRKLLGMLDAERKMTRALQVQIERYQTDTPPVGPTPTVDQRLSLSVPLAAYALNLLHGADLQTWEREHLVTLCATFGAHVGPAHIAMLAAYHAALRKIHEDRNRAVDEALELRAQLRAKSWWQKLRGIWR